MHTSRPGLLRGFTHQVWTPWATFSQARRPTNCSFKTDSSVMPCRTSNCRHQCGLHMQEHLFYSPLKCNQSPTTTRCALLVLPRLTPPGTHWPSCPNGDARHRPASHSQNKKWGRQYTLTHQTFTKLVALFLLTSLLKIGSFRYSSLSRHT